MTYDTHQTKNNEKGYLLKNNWCTSVIFLTDSVGSKYMYILEKGSDIRVNVSVFVTRKSYRDFVIPRYDYL